MRRSAQVGLLHCALRHTVESELAFVLATQLEEKFGAVVSVSIHCIDETHARRLLEVRTVCDGLQEDLRLVVDIRRGDQGDIVLDGVFTDSARAEHEDIYATVADFEGAKVFVEQGDWRRLRGERFAVVMFAGGVRGS